MQNVQLISKRSLNEIKVEDRVGEENVGNYQ